MGAAKQNCSCHSLHPPLLGILSRERSSLRFMFWNSRAAHFQALSLRGHLCPWQSPGSRIRWNTGWFEKSVPQDCHVAALLAMTNLKVCTAKSNLSLRKPLGFPCGEAVSQRLTDGGCEAESRVNHKCKGSNFRSRLFGYKKRRLTFVSRLSVGVTYLPGQSPGKYCRRRCA